MDPHVNLPWDSEEEILSRLPIQSLARFKTVCKRWNVLFDDRRFLKKRPQFIFLTKSKICSIDIVDHNSIDPKIELNELPSSHNPCQDSNLHYNFMITTCDDLLFCKYPSCMKKWPALWNPCLRQFKWIKYEAEQFEVFGLGYDNSKSEKVYKILGSITRKRAAVYECPSREFKFIDTPDEAISKTAKQSHVSLNGSLYWIAYDRKIREYFIQSFDFSRDHFETCCLLPGEENRSCDELVLAVFIGDRFSLLKQCYVTRKIEIWVTKKKIDRDEVVWVSLMTLTASTLPRLFNKVYGISYFICGKTLIMCCGDDETREPCIYVAREDLCNKIQIDSETGWFSHCVYVPSLISVPLEFN